MSLVPLLFLFQMCAWGTIEIMESIIAGFVAIPDASLPSLPSLPQNHPSGASPISPDGTRSFYII